MAVPKSERKALARAAMGKPPAAPQQPPQQPKDEAAPAANANGSTKQVTEEAAAEPQPAPVVAPPPPIEMVDQEITETLVAHEERIDNLEELTTELHQALDKALEGGQSPAEARLAALFELKLKTAGTKLGQEVGAAAGQAVERATLALGKSGEAMGKATEALRVAQTTKEEVDLVIRTASEALDSAALVNEAVEEMRQIGEFVAEAKETMTTLIDEVRTEMAALREELAAMRSANAPTPPPAPPVEVVEEPAKKFRPWQKA